MYPNSLPLVSDSLTPGGAFKVPLGSDDSDINYYHSNGPTSPHASKIPSFPAHSTPPLAHRNTQQGFLGKYNNCTKLQSRPPWGTQNGPLNFPNNITGDTSYEYQGCSLKKTMSSPPHVYPK